MLSSVIAHVEQTYRFSVAETPTQILFWLGLINLLIGCFALSPPHLAVGAGAALALWREHRMQELCA